MVFDHLRKIDWFLASFVSLLIFLGLLSLWSLSLGSYSFFYRQIVWTITGFGLFFAISLFDYRILKDSSAAVLLLYAVFTALLVLLFYFGADVRGVESWFSFKGLLIQPVEAVKIVLAILLAKYFSKRHINIYQPRHIVISGAYALLPIVLVMLQPDLGSAIVLAVLWISVTLFSGIKLKHFFVVTALFLLVLGLGWNNILLDYQKERFLAFINPYHDSKGAGYNIIQSLIAVGSGGPLGKGIGQGSQSHLLFLPEAETDFIFAAFAEEWGFIGGIFLLIIYSVLLFRMLKIGTASDNNFAKLFILGFVAIIFSQVLIHVGMNIGLLPITGITLPFVSYGGSSLVTLMAGMGVVQSIKAHS